MTAIFTIDGVCYHTTEQYIMASKARLFGDEETLAEIITVTILHKFLPFGSHLSRSLNEVVFGTQVVAVVSLINLSNIIQKAFEGLSIAVLDCYCLTDDGFRKLEIRWSTRWLYTL